MYDLSVVDHEGWLTKRSRWLHDWRRRYFLLKADKLFFSADPFSAPHGMIDLSTCITVKSAETKTQQPNSLEVATPQETFFLMADSGEEKDFWIGIIGRAIVKASGTFTTENDMHYEGSSDDEDIGDEGGDGDDTGEAPYY